MPQRHLTRRQFAGGIGATTFGSLVPCARVLAAATRTLRFAFSDSSPPYTSGVDGRCQGILPDLLNLVFEHTPDYDVECISFPWARAQVMVQENLMDGLCTYPSEKRKEYLNFSHEYLFAQDMGYLAYNKKKPGIERLTEVRNYEDLARFEFMGVNGVGWEVDNIPPNIRRQLVPSLTTAFNLLFKRQNGDFMVISIEQAVRNAKSLGIDVDDVGFVRADFITNHLVPYHIGLRKNLLDSAAIIIQITDVIRSAEFRNQRAAILAKYKL